MSTINRFIRKTALLAKIEAAYKTDAVPTGGANAMLISNVQVDPFSAENVDRALLREYFGASEQLAGIANVRLRYEIELAGAGAAGTAPPWGVPLRACSVAETITVSSHVEYNPITDDPESATQYWYDSGVLHKLLGSRGNAQPRLNLAGKPVIAFDFIGLYGGISASAVPTTTLTAFQKPLIVTDGNTGDVTLGCSYAAGALTGGTAYPSMGIEFNVGNGVEHAAILGDESVDVTGREGVGSLMLALTAAQEVTFQATVQANSTQTLGLVHGTTAGNIVGLYAPAVQLTNYKKGEYKGRRMIGYDLRFLPSVGDDEWLLFVK